MSRYILILWSLLCFSATKAAAETDLLDFSDDDAVNVSSSNTQKDEGQIQKASFFESALSLFSRSSTSDEKKISPEELKQKIEKGDVQAMLDLGYAYLYGINGVKADYKQALFYYEMAGNKKNPVALNNLGSFYFNGIGTKVNYGKAIQYFEEAAGLGSSDAAVNLAVIYLASSTKTKQAADLQKAYDLLMKAQNDNDVAKYLAGYAYYRGFLSTQDYKKAFLLIKAAADAGYDEAQLVISDFYINGHGTPKNYTRAVQYLKKAIAQGHSGAMMKLGDILVEGKLYTKDISQAHIYYNIASVMGVDDAAHKRDAIERILKIEELLSIQSEAEEYKPEPTKLTLFIRQTFGNSLKIYIDSNMKLTKSKSNIKS